MTARRRAFTLLELMIVMAIITILAGLLLPVLKGALDTARQVTCMSNLRQIGLAHQVYAGDFDEWMAILGRGTDADFLAARDLPELGYLECPPMSGVAPKIDEARGTVWDDPAKEKGYRGTGNTDYGTCNYTFAYNMEAEPPIYSHVPDWDRDGSGDPIPPYLALGMLVDREMPFRGWGVFYDSSDPDKGPFQRTMWTCNTVGQRYRPVGRHEGRGDFQYWPHPGGGANYLYRTGHVQCVRPPEPWHPFAPWSGTEFGTMSKWSVDHWRVNVIERNPKWRPGSW